MCVHVAVLCMCTEFVKKIAVMCSFKIQSHNFENCQVLTSAVTECIFEAMYCKSENPEYILYMSEFIHNYTTNDQVT